MRIIKVIFAIIIAIISFFIIIGITGHAIAAIVKGFGALALNGMGMLGPNMTAGLGLLAEILGLLPGAVVACKVYKWLAACSFNQCPKNDGQK